ncbi:MAG: DNRLRE domain-containing protein, partial [Chloroflexota bacterium]
VTVAGSGDSSDPAQILNYIGNYEIKGADSKNVKNLVIFTPEGKDNDKKGHKIYVEGNIGGRRSSLSEDEWLVVSDKWGDDLDGIPNAWKLSKPFSIDGIPVTTQDYETAYDMVLEEAGANIVRDAVDARIVKEVKNRTGRIIDRPEDVGGFPKLSGGNAPKDSDRDGMPDSWEQQQGLNPNNPADGSGDLDGDGYTNVEEYLNRADKSSQSLPPTPTMSFQLSFPVMMNGYTGNTSGSGSDNSGSDNSGSDNSGSDNTPITLVSIDDTYTRDGSYETDNYGSNDVMQIRNRSVDGEDKKAYIKFDISSIDNISSATLRLYGRVRRDTNTLVIYSVGSNSWDEMEVTANNAPDFDREVATLSLDNNEDQWLEIDLTEHVKSHKEKGRPKLSLMLYSSEDGESVMYVKSKEHDNAPELIIR